MKKQLLTLAAVAATATAANAATIIQGDVTAGIGSDFFFDNAATGGGNYDHTTGLNGAITNRDFGGFAQDGLNQVSITGIGWALRGSTTATTATSVTFGFTYLGADGVAGGTGANADVDFGSATGTLSFGGAGEYYYVFDSALTETIQASSTSNVFAVSLNTNGGLSMKVGTNSSDFDGANISIAGTSAVAVPEPSSTALLGLGGLALILRRRK